MLKSQVLKTSKFLVAFLEETNQDAFNARLLQIEQEQGPKNIYEFKTLTGEIEVDKRERATKFCEQLKNFSRRFELLNNFICDRSKELQFRSHALADDYFAIAAEIKAIAEMLQCAEIPQITNFYNRIADMMVKNGDFVLHSGELVNQSVGSWFKYARQESRCFKECHWLRNESVNRYQTLKQSVEAKKEKLFKQRDVR